MAYFLTQGAMLFRGDNMSAIAILLSLIITTLSIFIIKPVAIHARLLDSPNGRKQHVGDIPLIGGIAIFTGIACASLLIFSSEAGITSWLLCSLGIVLLGVADDAEDLSVYLRMAMQSLLTIAVCLGTDVYLDNLGNLVGLGNVHLDMAGYVLTIFLFLAVINAFNMLDGIDGLLGIVAFITFGSLALLFGFAGLNHYVIISLICMAALIPYLLNNLLLPPFKQKIFMGDAGSTFIGFTVIWLLLEGTQPSDTSAFRPITAVWIIALPLMDMVRVIFYRISAKRSPFKAGRDHLHHILLTAGFGKIQTLLLMIGLELLLCSIGLLSEYKHTSEAWMFFSFLGSFFIYQLLVNQLARSGFKFFIQTEQRNPATSESN